jgi:hypothetical protein
MDEYPSGSLGHNLPLLVVSGLTTAPTKPLLTDPDLKDQSILIRSEIPPVDSREAKAILRHIQEADGSSAPWHAPDASVKYRFKVKTIGRVSRSISPVCVCVCVASESPDQNPRTFSFRRGAPVFPMTSRLLCRLPCYTRPSRPSAPARPCTRMA